MLFRDFTLGGIFRTCLVLFLLVFVGAVLYYFLSPGDTEVSEGIDVFGTTCNVTALDVHGCIYTYAPDTNLAYDSGCDNITASEEISMRLRDAKEDDSVKAVLLDIDSLGGQAQAALEIEESVKDTGKPTVALIRGYGDSAAYWVASAAKTIIASKESDVGSIGVTMSYVDNAKQNTELGLTYHSLSTGKFKDTGDPNKPLSEEEEAYLRKSLARTFEHFIETVSQNRNLPIERVRELADGSTWMGEEALEKGLIDKLGTYKEALAELEKEIGEKAVVCWPQYAE